MGYERIMAQFARLPSSWTQKVMGFWRLWVSEIWVYHASIWGFNLTLGLAPVGSIDKCPYVLWWAVIWPLHSPPPRACPMTAHMIHPLHAQHQQLACCPCVSPHASTSSPPASPPCCHLIITHITCVSTSPPPVLSPSLHVVCSTSFLLVLLVLHSETYIL